MALPPLDWTKLAFSEDKHPNALPASWRRDLSMLLEISPNFNWELDKSAERVNFVSIPSFAL
jgi:hypothetical protein